MENGKIARKNVENFEKKLSDKNDPYHNILSGPRIMLLIYRLGRNRCNITLRR